MDNPQERLIADLNWLAGIWEGEGWFGFGYRRSPPGRQFCPNCGIANTDPTMISEVRKILDDQGLAYYMRASRISGMGKKPKQEIYILGVKRTKRFLTVLRPFLRTKADRADCILQFIAFRETVSRKYPYGTTEDTLYRKLRQLNGHPLSSSSEITRPASSV